MVRKYDVERAVPPEVVDRILQNALRSRYSDEPPRDLSKRRKPMTDLIHRSRWTA